MSRIADYESLQAAVVEYLAREQDDTLVARLPGFVQLAEAKFNRQLFVRQMEQRAIAVTDPSTVDAEFIALPSDFQSMRRIRVASIRGKPPLEFRSGLQIDEYRLSVANSTGQPRYFTIVGGEIEIAPTPDKVCTVEMVYRRTIPPLAANGTNWLLGCAPDLYLYGVLLETAPYTKEDGRIATWSAALAAALGELNDLGLTSAFNAGPMAVRVSGQVI